MTWEEVTVAVWVSIGGGWTSVVAMEVEKWLPSGYVLNRATPFRDEESEGAGR